MAKSVRVSAPFKIQHGRKVLWWMRDYYDEGEKQNGNCKHIYPFPFAHFVKSEIMSVNHRAFTPGLSPVFRAPNEYWGQSSQFPCQWPNLPARVCKWPWQWVKKPWALGSYPCPFQSIWFKNELIFPLHPKWISPHQSSVLQHVWTTYRANWRNI